MKGLKRLFCAVAVLAATMSTLVSCGRDSIATDVDNVHDNSYWEGTITQTTFIRNWNSTQAITNVTYLDLKFSYDPRTYSSGTGVEYSYAQSYNGWYTFENSFNYTVYNEYRTYRGNRYPRCIDMWYSNGDRMTIYLHTYNYNNSFKGYVVNNGVDIGDCEFVKRSGWRQYDYYNQWNGYSRSRAAAEDADSVAVQHQ